MSNFISLEKGIAINGIEYNLHLSSKKPKVGFDVRTLVCFDAKLDKIKSKFQLLDNFNENINENVDKTTLIDNNRYWGCRSKTMVNLNY